MKGSKNGIKGLVFDNPNSSSVRYLCQLAGIESLPEELKVAITLREIEGLSYEEIAELMDCPIGTVRSRIFRARETIAEKLKPLLSQHNNKRW